MRDALIPSSTSAVPDAASMLDSARSSLYEGEDGPKYVMPNKTTLECHQSARSQFS